MKNMKNFILIIFLLFSAQITYAYSAEIDYDEVYVDYSVLNYNKWQKTANNYLYLAKKSKTEKTRVENYGRAAGAYQTLTKINPANPTNFAILGHIYSKLNKQELAKSYLDMAVNLDTKNAIVNKYYGEYYFDNKNYRHALKHFKIAYNNGMQNDYELNCDIGLTYAKLGEIPLARAHYLKANKLKPSSEISKKIRLLDELKKR